MKFGNLRKRKAMLPPWLIQKIANPPQAGAGVNVWLFSVARHLHAHRTEVEIEGILRDATAGVGRPVSPEEIRRAVTNSQPVAWSLTGGAGSTPSSRPTSEGRQEETEGPRPQWPAPDPEERWGAIREAAWGNDGVATLGDLWARSPRLAVSERAEDYLAWLFDGAEWACLAPTHPGTAVTMRLSYWAKGKASKAALVVPSPMLGPWGKNQSGVASTRCLDNTGPRRWLVIEFDSGTVDEQAALHWQLAQAAAAMGWPRLRLVVHSQGKSLHGFYGLCGEERETEEMMAYAILLGADRATWTRSQLIRMPAGQRVVEGKPVRQVVWFWDQEYTLWGK